MKKSKKSEKFAGKDLSMIAGLDLLKVSFELKKRTASRQELCMEVGMYGNKFYLLDFATNNVSRITLGAFNHLSEAWKRDKSLAKIFA